jgi:hypothetical protein
VQKQPPDKRRKSDIMKRRENESGPLSELLFARILSRNHADGKPERSAFETGFTGSRQAKLRGRGSRKAETSQQNSGVNWNPTRERLATTGSEFCVVASNGGMKRKQPAQMLNV